MSLAEAIQRGGVTTGPPSRRDADAATEVPNRETLLMNPGDTVTFHMWDAPLPGGGDIGAAVHEQPNSTVPALKVYGSSMVLCPLTQNSKGLA